MDFVTNNILTLILFSPTLVALFMLFLPSGEKKLLRWVAFLGSLIPFGFSLLLWFSFNKDIPGFQFETQSLWYEVIGSSFHLGVDGLSLPMDFRINQWGSEKGERELWGGRKVSARTYASFKFLIYTMAGSLGLLLAIQMIGVSFDTFDLTQIYDLFPTTTSLANIPFNLSLETVKAIAFWAFVIAFAIKVPVWPFHTWLPDAHTEAPTAGSMILAGVLLKLGAYGFLGLVLPF